MADELELLDQDLANNQIDDAQTRISRLRSQMKAVGEKEGKLRAELEEELAGEKTRIESMEKEIRELEAEMQRKVELAEHAREKEVAFYLLKNPYGIYVHKY